MIPDSFDRSTQMPIYEAIVTNGRQDERSDEAMDDRVIVVVAYDGSDCLNIACVTSSLDIANRIGATPRYRVVLATQGGRAITCDSGLELQAQAALERLTTPMDTLLVSGGLGHEQAAVSPNTANLRDHLVR
jgi:transcriptional regulator GlxA family with amidase domain